MTLADKKVDGNLVAVKTPDSVQAEMLELSREVKEGKITVSEFTAKWNDLVSQL